MIILIIAQALLTIAVLYFPQAAVFIGDRLNNNFLFKILVAFAGLSSMEPKYQAAIGCTVILITYRRFGIKLLKANLQRGLRFSEDTETIAFFQAGIAEVPDALHGHGVQILLKGKIIQSKSASLKELWTTTWSIF